MAPNVFFGCGKKLAANRAPLTGLRQIAYSKRQMVLAELIRQIKQHRITKGWAEYGNVEVNNVTHISGGDRVVDLGSDSRQ
jgi:hypothetical protein